MAEQITFPADNSTFTIGNTTYVWDDPPGIWRAYTVGDFSGGGGSGVDPNWIPSFAANSTLVSTGNDFSGTLFTAPADGNGTWGILDTGSGEATTNVPITTTDSNTWGYNPDEGYLSGNTTLIRAQLPGNGGSRTAWVYLAPGDSLVFGSRVDRGSYRYVELEAYGAAGGGSTTVNIGGGSGGGLVLGEFFSQTVTASTTSLTLDHTGPAWVFLTAGSGSGAVRVNTNPDDGRTGRGGNGGSGGFFLQDVSVLEGANVVIGTGGTGVVITRQPNQERVGVSGTGSSMTWSGITLTCTAGAAAGIISNGADGTATIAGTDAPTLLTNAEVTTEAEAYWRDFVVASTGGNLQLGSGAVSVPVTTGSAGDYTQTTAGTTAQASSVAGSAGQLYIVYQNQA